MSQRKINNLGQPPARIFGVKHISDLKTIMNKLSVQRANLTQKLNTMNWWSKFLKLDRRGKNETFISRSRFITIWNKKNNIYYSSWESWASQNVQKYGYCTWFSSLVPSTNVSSALILDRYFSSRVFIRLFCCSKAAVRKQQHIKFLTKQYETRLTFLVCLTFLICSAWVEIRRSISWTTFLSKYTTR